NPKLIAAWNGLGWSQLNLGIRDEAEKSFQKCVEIDPNFAPALNGLGWITFGRRDYEHAEQFWLKAVKTPNVSASWSGLAQLYLLQGKWDEAQTWAQKLVNSGDTGSQNLLDAAKNKKLPDELRQQIEPQSPTTQP